MSHADIDLCDDRFAAYLKGLEKIMANMAAMLRNCAQEIISPYGIFKRGRVLAPCNVMLKEEQVTCIREESKAPTAGRGNGPAAWRNPHTYRDIARRLATHPAMPIDANTWRISYA